MTLALADATVSIVVACISAAIAITSLAWQARTESQRQQREHEHAKAEKETDRRLEAEDLVRRYREPLVFAADQLLNRIENIRDNRFIEKYGQSRRDYVVTSTTYAIAELLGWMEILRLNQQYLDLGEQQATRRMNECLAGVGRTLSTDSILGPSGQPAGFMIWRQEQRAIGELMIDRSAEPAQCIGYATFTERLEDPRFAGWLERVLSASSAAIDEPVDVLPRLSRLAEAITALIDNLDPDRVRALKR
jgi:hypothetical protein